MTLISQYEQDLRSLADDLGHHIGKIIEANEGRILQLIKLRLYNQGRDATGSLITPPYSIKTIISKQKEGKRKSHVTLRDVGNFYAGMYVKYLYDKNNIEIYSIDKKTDQLISKYGPDILGLTIEEQEFVIQSIIEPEINKIINKINSVQIELEF